MPTQSLTAGITASATVTADVNNAQAQVGGEYLVVDALIGANAQVGGEYLVVDASVGADAQVGGIYLIVDAVVPVIESLVAGITASATVTADLSEFINQALIASITTTATVATNLNVGKSVSSTISFTSVGDTFNNVRVGNTLQLKQNAALINTLNVVSALGISLTDSAEYDIRRNYSLSQSIIFTQSASASRTLPTESASSNLNLTDSAVPFRLAQNTLLLTHEVIGTIYYLEGIASNTLSLSQLADLATSVYNLEASNILNLTQDVDYDWYTDLVCSNTILLHQIAVGTLVTSKKYVLLQAPFNFIQTSIVLPSPLFGDTENIISNMTLKKSMNNTTYTYVKSSKSRVLKYTFRLPRVKALELEEFCRYYNSDLIRMQNWKGEIWKINIMTNPIDFVQTGRDAPTEDRTDVNLEFEGVKLSG